MCTCSSSLFLCLSLSVSLSLSLSLSPFLALCLSITYTNSFSFFQLLCTFLVYQVTGSTDAPVYVIGTQIDKIPLEHRAARLREIEDYLWANAADKAYANDIEEIIFVDNTLSGTEDEDDTVVRLHQEIIDKMKDQLREEIPLRWLPFTSAVRRLARRKGLPWLTLGQVEQVARVVGGIEGKEVQQMLQFHHNLGHVLHYAKNPQLCDRVIINVEWLLKMVSALFVPVTKSRQNKRLRKEFDLLQNHGILLEHLAQHLWEENLDKRGSQHIKDRCNRSFIFSLMEQFALVFNTHQTMTIKGLSSRKFFVPALVAKVADEAQAKGMACEVTRDLFLTCNEKLLFPQTLFWCLVVRCMQQYNSHRDPVLLRSTARVLFHGVFWLVLHYFQHGIKVVVEKEQVAQMVGAGVSAEIALRDACHEILPFLEGHLIELKGSALESLDISRAAQCLCAYTEHSCAKHKVQGCKHLDCQHFAPIVIGDVPRCPLGLRPAVDVTELCEYWPLTVSGPGVAEVNTIRFPCPS